jgi:eukaryotic-like serine/threonine-protein kinase
MTLTAGTKLGPYEIVALIGAGGMGEVYRARDQRLGREVAVKVLPVSFAADADRLRRFEQEARAVAALSHPNILAIHDIGQHDSAPFLVAELLDGESLREALSRSPLSYRKAVDYATQIAHGLAAAHSKNIAHRDLKPDNIFITRDGRVKILDFGLAKPLQDSASSDSRTATLTETAGATDAGTVLGTASYMSPEQVRGAAVDARTDIFSFGAVLYEMLSGKRAFKRDTTAETMTAILKEEPPELLESGAPIPPALDRIVRHCLEKIPEQRFQSARDLAFDLESLSTLTSTGSSTAAAVKERRDWRYAAGALALLVLAGLGGWKLATLLKPSAGAQFREVTYRRGTLGNARFTPDGQSIIYTASWEGSSPELYTVAATAVGGRPLDIKNARLLSISRNGELAVSLSPEEITTVLTPGDLARASNTGGAPKAEIANVQTADYSPGSSDLAIVRFVPDEQMCQLEFPIGKVLYRDRALNELRFSPNGKYLAFIAHGDPGDDRGRVVILRRTGEKVTIGPLYDSAQGLAWSASGDEVWSSSPLGFGQIHALALSGKTRDPLTIPGRLWLRDIATDGRLLVEQGITRRGMIVSSRNGQEERDLSWLDFGYLRAISNDGKTILFEEEGGAEPTYRAYVRNVDGSPATPIGEGYALALSPDKSWALTEKLTEPARELWLVPVGPGEARRLSPPNLAPLTAASFFPDGKRVLYVARDGDKPVRSWAQDISGGPPRPVTPEGVAGWRISPDSQWLFARKNLEIGNDAFLVSIATGEVVPIKNMKPDEAVLGWTNNDELYVGSALTPERMALHVDKLNPRTGARTPWRDLAMPPLGGIRPDRPLITPDGTSFAFDYRLRFSDLYTVSGVR